MAEGNGQEWPSDIKDIGDKIAALTVSKAVELGDYLETVHKIKPAAGGGVMMTAPVAVVDKPVPVEKSEWSVHFNVSPDGKLFAGDGGGPRSVAAPNNGQWIYLFTPVEGRLKAEKLVDLSKHDYALEPNLTFTPDGKRIVFRSNMHGASHVYAVEIAKP